MVIGVRLFARARDLVGTDLLRLELPDPATVRDLREALAKHYPNVAGLSARSAVAVREEFASEDAVIHAGEEVALIPPVSGGTNGPSTAI